MSCVLKSSLHSIRQRKHLVVIKGLEIREALFHIFHRIERSSSIPSRPFVFTILPLHLHLLNMSTVSKHHLAEIERGLRADHLPPNSFFDQFGNQTTVVDVGVSKKDKGKIPW